MSPRDRETLEDMDLSAFEVIRSSDDVVPVYRRKTRPKSTEARFVKLESRVEDQKGGRLDIDRRPYIAGPAKPSFLGHCSRWKWEILILVAFWLLTPLYLKGPPNLLNYARATDHYWLQLVQDATDASTRLDRWPKEFDSWTFDLIARCSRDGAKDYRRIARYARAQVPRLLHLQKLSIEILTSDDLLGPEDQCLRRYWSGGWWLIRPARAAYCKWHGLAYTPSPSLSYNTGLESMAASFDLVANISRTIGNNQQAIEMDCQFAHNHFRRNLDIAVPRLYTAMDGGGMDEKLPHPIVFMKDWTVDHTWVKIHMGRFNSISIHKSYDDFASSTVTVRKDLLKCLGSDRYALDCVVNARAHFELAWQSWHDKVRADPAARELHESVDTIVSQEATDLMQEKGWSAMEGWWTARDKVQVDSFD